MSSNEPVGQENNMVEPDQAGQAEARELSDEDADVSIAGESQEEEDSERQSGHQDSEGAQESPMLPGYTPLDAEQAFQLAPSTIDAPHQYPA
ncbi:hypothetical protein CBOM_00543 [Ceraceosorus bombacis]|uniref:Uncharacterized protein n=1 Tax=Ceraceosorus bombacis TaxID=401625 RepID=A0A0P1BAC1_9BASI|nr:hypothetical protein CBOM_00543 [Ceraceosorus bombacis]